MKESPSDPLTARRIIEFRLVYHMNMSPIDIGRMSDPEVMRYYHMWLIQKGIESKHAKRQADEMERKANKNRIRRR